MVSEYRRRGSQHEVDGVGREWGTGEVRITEVLFFRSTGESTTTFQWGEAMDAVIHYDAKEKIVRPVFGFAITDKSGSLIHGSNTQIERYDTPSIEGKGAIRLHVDSLNMSTGTYLFSFAVHSEDHKTNYHRLDNWFPVSIVSEKPFEGMCHIPCHWQMESR